MSKQKNCPVAHKCGGCQLQNLEYADQLLWKQKRCRLLLSQFAQLEPIIGMEKPYHYRNKVQAAFGMNRSGVIISGVYQASTHHIVTVDQCYIEDQKADAIIVSIRKLMKSFRLSAYQEVKERGFLRHVLVKRGFESGEIMVVLVTSTPIFPSRNHFVAALRREHPEITTIIQNVNDKLTSLVLGKNEKVLYGSGKIVDYLCGCKFYISSKSFYQINPVQTEKLYAKAMEFANLKDDELVLDAYCGIGTIGILASKHAGQVVGVEINQDAVRDAIQNAKANKIKNIYFHTMDAGDFMHDMAEEKEKCDVLFMDPPRAGASEKFLHALCEMRPSRVVYISCNPDTLAENLQYMIKNQYKVKQIQPVDMFPHTNHIECVVLLENIRK